MSEPHVIRLRGPWFLQPNADGAAKVKGTTGKPWREFLGEYTGTVTYRRNFNRPTNLAGERVVLVVSEAIGELAIALNSQSVNVEPNLPIRTDISNWLESFNELTIDVSHDSSAGMVGEVWLEIG